MYSAASPCLIKTKNTEVLNNAPWPDSNLYINAPQTNFICLIMLRTALGLGALNLCVGPMYICT